MGKHTEAAITGICYNCGKKVGPEKLVVNFETRWPVCADCDYDLEIDSADEEE